MPAVCFHRRWRGVIPRNEPHTRKRSQQIRDDGIYFFYRRDLTIEVAVFASLVRGLYVKERKVPLRSFCFQRRHQVLRTLRDTDRVHPDEPRNSRYMG